MELIREYWGVVVAVIGSIAWLVRLESRGLSNEREIKRLWLQRKEDMEHAQRNREDQNRLLDEIRQDIKKLLGRNQS